MAEKLRESFKNPYIDESVSDARFSSVVSMDEAHERWLRGSWRADERNFDFDISELHPNDDYSAAVCNAQQANRFDFDLKRDIIDSDIDSDRLDGVSYDASYRPQGNVNANISNITIDRLRYNALADIREEIPEDMSYLYGGGSGYSTQKNNYQSKKNDRLARESTVDKRRAAIERMIPDRFDEDPEKIMQDIRRRQDIEDAKSGITREEKRRPERLGIYDVYSEPRTLDDASDPVEEYLRDEVNERGSWRSNIPVQDGMIPDSQTVPYFGRYSRKWSAMDKLEPSRKDMLRHTVNTIYEDDDEDNSAEEGQHGRFKSRDAARNGYYVADSDFDPYDMYRPLAVPRQRKSVEGGNVFERDVRADTYNNPYAEVSNARIVQMLDNDMHGPGQLDAPEGLTDPSLMYEWNMGYGRVNPENNRYAQWVQQQSQLAENAEQSRYRGSHRTGRPGAYIQREEAYGEHRRYPRRQQREREQYRRDMSEQMRKATQQGMTDGREIIRRQQEEQFKRYEEYCAKQREMYKKQQEQMIKQQQDYMARQQAAAKKQGFAAAKKTQNNSSANSPKYGPWGYYTQPQPQNQNSAPTAGKPAVNKKG